MEEFNEAEIEKMKDAITVFFRENPISYVEEAYQRALKEEHDRLEEYIREKRIREGKEKV